MKFKEERKIKIMIRSLISLLCKSDGAHECFLVRDIQNERAPSNFV